MSNLELALQVGLRPGRVLAILVLVVAPTSLYQLVALTRKVTLKRRVDSYLKNALELRGHNADQELVNGGLFVLGFVDSSKIRQMKQFVRTSLGSESSLKLVEIVNERYRVNSIPLDFTIRRGELSLAQMDTELSVTALSELLVSLGLEFERRVDYGTIA